MRPVAILASISTTSAFAFIPRGLPRTIDPNRTSQFSSITLEASSRGAAHGSIGQIADGQTRIGGGLPVAKFFFRRGPRGGEIVDNKGRGCILTPPTKQFQCDEGVSPTPGFDISCAGQLTYNDSAEFWASPVNDYGFWNVYTRPLANQKKSIQIQVKVHGNVDTESSRCKQVPSSSAKAGNDTELVLSSVPKGNHGVLSPDGSCGAPGGFHCFGIANGPCCSSLGWCGATHLHCGSGCQTEFGQCFKLSSGQTTTSTSSSKAPSSKTSVSSKHTTTSTSAKKAPSSKTSVSSGRMTASASSSKAPSSKTPVSSGHMTTSTSSSKAPSSKTPIPSEHTTTSASSSKATGSGTSAHKQSSSSSSPKPTAVSPNAKCAGTTGYHCFGFGSGSCCSSKGWCGSSPLHCGAGCQPLFGTCGNSTSNTTAPGSKASSHATSSTIITSSHIASSRTTVSSAKTAKPSSAVPASNDSVSFPLYGCPADLKGDFESTHRTFIVDKKQPNKTIIANAVRIIDDRHCTLHTFYVPEKFNGRKCSVIWLHPEEKDTDRAHGPKVKSNCSSQIVYWHLRDAAHRSMAWNKIGPKKILAVSPGKPGSAFNAQTFPCPAGTWQTVMLCGQNFSLKYDPFAHKPHVEHGQPGLFIRSC